MVDQTVVAATQRLSKQQLHAKVMRGWNRIIDKIGKGTFADRLGCSSVAIDKQLVGSMPGLEMIDAAFAIDSTVLDDWLKHHGVRLVTNDAVCDVDDLGLLMARVLVMIQEAEHPDSPGGRQIIHTEYLNGERIMREIHTASGRWIDRCSEIRKPREVAA